MSVVLELPAFYVDAGVLDGLSGATTYFEVINRDPGPGETGIRTDSVISFYLATHAADSPSATTLQVWISVNGGAEILVYDGGAGGFQPGYNGPLSATSVYDAATLRVIVDPTADFDSLAEVTVRIAATSTGSQLLAESWSFTVEDLTAPILVSAVARGKKTIRLTFDEPMTMGDPTEPDSALNPANYAFEHLTVPAVDVEAVSVAMVTTSIVDVTLDTEATAGATYRVTVTTAEDIIGNEILAPYNTADFVAYACPQPDGRDFDLWRMIPQKNREEDAGDLLRFISCLQEVTDLLLCLIDEWGDILDPDKAPEEFLDAMLADLGNPFTFDLDENDKRRLIRVLVEAYRQKGTAAGIINLIRFFLGIEVTITTFSGEGWELGIDELGIGSILGPGSDFGLYSFVIVSPIILTPEQREQIRDIANYMKPAHTHLIEIEEPETPDVIDHLELGLSELGPEWILH